MRHRELTIVVLAATVAWSAAAARSAGDGQAATAPQETGTSAERAERPKPAPSCMHCGATCGLTPICICKLGTKKQPRNRFTTTCEPICVAGCGSKPWPFGRRGGPGGCTSCCGQSQWCPGWVRTRKTLKRETVDEEVPTIERSVGFICCRCGGDGPTASRAGGGCLARPEPRASGWWPEFAGWLKPW